VNDDYKIELFVFPDGTAIEMIVFEGPPGHAEAAGPAPHAGTTSREQERARPAGALSTASCPAPSAPPPCDEGIEASTCPICGGRLVYPVDWARAGEAVWDITLRCPECETRREVSLGRAAVEHFNRDLYHGAQTLAKEAERLMRSNFEDEVERITSALEQDLILPMDF